MNKFIDAVKELALITMTNYNRPLIKVVVGKELGYTLGITPHDELKVYTAAGPVWIVSEWEYD